MKITVEVTQEDIDLGKPQDSEHCAIARALHRVTNNPLLVVGTNWIRLRGKENSEALIARLTDEALQLRRDFDFEKPVEPLSFELEIPDEYVLEAVL